MKGVPFQEAKAEILKVYPGLRVCGCSCHQDGQQVIHCMPCCDLCYDKFIYEDGSVDYDRLKMHADDKALSCPSIKEPPKKIGDFGGPVSFPKVSSEFPDIPVGDIISAQPLSSGEKSRLFYFEFIKRADDDILRE